MTMDKSETIKIQVGEEVIELVGAELEAFIAQRTADQAELDAFKAEQDAKAAAKASALTKLQALGLSEAEAKQIVGI
jgi:hypothetical protein